MTAIDQWYPGGRNCFGEKPPIAELFDRVRALESKVNELSNVSAIAHEMYTLQEKRKAEE